MSTSGNGSGSSVDGSRKLSHAISLVRLRQDRPISKAGERDTGGIGDGSSAETPSSLPSLSNVLAKLQSIALYLLTLKDFVRLDSIFTAMDADGPRAFTLFESCMPRKLLSW